MPKDLRNPSMVLGRCSKLVHQELGLLPGSLVRADGLRLGKHGGAVPSRYFAEILGFATLGPGIREHKKVGA